jgi:hypothetical protein
MKKERTIFIICFLSGILGLLSSARDPDNSHRADQGHEQIR